MVKGKLPKKYRLLFTLLVVVSVLLTSGFSTQNKPSQDPQPEQAKKTQSETAEEENEVLSVHVTATTSAIVNRVVDGDTIEVILNNAKVKVRLIGIDTPESVDPRKPVQCLGKEASNRLKELISKKEVRLEGDSSQQDRDRYNRLLRYVYLNDQLINKQLIQEGYAQEYTYDLPYIYQQEFRGAQNEAEINKSGLWNPDLCVQN